MSSNTKRIAKNTLLLYFRQILTMLISLYTVRIILDVLGIEDYGIYNVVAGFVVIFSFLNSAMTSATQRFLNYAMGEKDDKQLGNVFSLSIIIHVIIALLAVVLAETLGLWIFKTFLSIPRQRYNAAFLVYQFSVLATVINIVKVPFGALVIAHEKMSFYAFISIFEAIFKLAVAFLLLILLYDKLIIYSLLTSISALIIFIIKIIYCKKMFNTVCFNYNKDILLLKNFTSFSFWSVFGQLANLCKVNGTNVILNIFHGVTLNAAMGLSTQVKMAVFTFVSNFQTAFRPQIVKSYAVRDFDYFFKLIFQTSKISFYLMFIFSLPLFLNLDFVLFLWLKEYPDYSVIFIRIMIIDSLLNALSGPLYTSIQATGDIKKYQIITSILVILNLPVSLLFLYLKFSPVYILITRLAIDSIILAFQVYLLRIKVNFSVFLYIKDVILPILAIMFIVSGLSIFINVFFIDWACLLLSCAVSVAGTVLLAYFFGLNSQEKIFINDWITRKLLKHR
ncbi:MAG: oligosaccharide flippase family protein [Treponema sp.]|jgi:O-antigen/teichoic acid export membrane protein|nr:oligosaccharide flippase family protein [Treponema sp.]